MKVYMSEIHNPNTWTTPFKIIDCPSCLKNKGCEFCQGLGFIRVQPLPDAINYYANKEKTDAT